MFEDELLFMNSKADSTIHKPTSFSAFKLETTINLAGVAQLVECQLPKLNVAGSSPVSRFFLITYKIPLWACAPFVHPWSNFKIASLLV